MQGAELGVTSIHEIKHREVLPAPVLLMECRLRDGRVERWSTNRVVYGGETYEPRVIRHNQFDMRLGAEEGIDSSSRFSVTLANVDSRYSQLERTAGWKGATLTVRFAFYDLRAGTVSTEPVAVFLGVANPPEEITEKTIRLSFVNRLSLQRITLPAVRVQPRCPWLFPATLEQRGEAVSGGEKGAYSRFHACGYSPDVDGGAGNLAPEGTAYTSCNYTKGDCLARGMYDADSGGRQTARFGGFQFLPPSISVRTHGSKEARQSELLDNRAQVNDVLPMVYGTAWIQAPVVFARNDGNLTHCEVLLGLGLIEGVHKVLVSGVEIPMGVTGRDMTATGWYNVVSLGTRNGGFNLNFRDGSGQPLGDPHGSIGILAVAVPNRLSDGRTAPKVEVLLDGLHLEQFDAEGQPSGVSFTKNPAWILLDLLRRSGWRLEEIDVISFAEAAAHCDRLIEAKDANGNVIATRLFECNLALTRRRSAAEVVRGVRLSAALLLTFDTSGRLQLRAEGSMATQNPEKPESSNSTTAWNGGWPSYEFGDGTHGFSGLLRHGSGDPALRWWSRSTSECANRLSVEFQNAFNEYQQDGVSLADQDDVLITGQELSASLPAIGLPHFDQAIRITRFNLMKGIQGNGYIEFETGLHSLGLRPGDLITVTYLKEGFERAPFRILKIAPSENYATARIVAQQHLEGWYELLEGAESVDAGLFRTSGRQGGVPRPLAGVRLNSDGEQEFEVKEAALNQTDGSAAVQLRVRFQPPARPSASAVAVPLLGLSPRVETTGGSLRGGESWYYAISGLNAEGGESDLSFAVRTSLPAITDTNRVVLRDISLAPGTTGIRVYRGWTPQQLLLIGESNGVQTQFTDDGLETALTPPPDPHYDHANFYWRLELMPEVQATLHGTTWIGNSSLGMLEHEYRGASVRIVRGRGRGQERAVMDNNSTTLTLATPWTTEPDATSFFVVSETSWRFCGATRSTDISFEVLNREGTVVQISGRSANALDQETPSELSVLHRHLVGGATGSEGGDADRPPQPVFALSVGRRGQIEVLGIGFETLDNTRTVTAGTLTLHYWDELSAPSSDLLSAAMGAAEKTLTLASGGTAAPGDVVRVGEELMRVEQQVSSGVLLVERGAAGSQPQSHEAGSAVWRLRRYVLITPFPRGFFGSPASGSYTSTLRLPHVRIAAAEFHVTNSVGDSPSTAACYTALAQGGLRTLSGGQYTIQIPGEPVLENSAAPPLVIDETQAVGDIYATLAEAPAGGSLSLRLRLNGEPYCTLTIAAGERVSEVVEGWNLQPLDSGANLTIDVIDVPTGAGSRPGRNLTVTIRV